MNSYNHCSKMNSLIKDNRREDLGSKEINATWKSCVRTFIVNMLIFLDDHHLLTDSVRSISLIHSRHQDVFVFTDKNRCCLHSICFLVLALSINGSNEKSIESHPVLFAFGLSCRIDYQIYVNLIHHDYCRTKDMRKF